MTVHPPAWAQSLVSMLVPHRTRDSVVGDLLEEYREQAPARGEAAADRWYIRQALGFVWRASLNPGFALGGNFAGRMVLDVVGPVSNLASRSQVTTFIAMAIFAIWGFRLGRATGRVGGALVMAIVASVAGSTFALVLTLAAMGVAGLVLDVDARTWAALLEGLDIPLPIIAVIGVVLASAGAACGRMFTGSSGSRSSIRT